MQNQKKQQYIQQIVEAISNSAIIKDCIPLYELEYHNSLDSQLVILNQTKNYLKNTVVIPESTYESIDSVVNFINSLSTAAHSQEVQTAQKEYTNILQNHKNSPKEEFAQALAVAFNNVYIAFLKNIPNPTSK